METEPPLHPWSPTTIRTAVLVYDLLAGMDIAAIVQLHAPPKPCRVCGLFSHVLVTPPGSCTVCWSTKVAEADGTDPRPSSVPLPASASGVRHT